ncbi:MAG: cytochrome b/b6 domain-containing protein [Pseudomonadota bacterium]
MSVTTPARDTSHLSEPVERYTRVAMVLHWAMALLILAQIAGGLWMAFVSGEADEGRFVVYQLHKTFGLVVLALALARIVWRLAHPAPELPEGMTSLERIAAHGTHVAFYALMVLVPLSGWLMVSVSPTGIPTFFLMIEALPFAHLPIGKGLSAEEMKAAETLWINVHFTLALATLGLFSLHVAAALKHQFVARDQLIARMVPQGNPDPYGTQTRSSAGTLGFGAAALFLAGGLWVGAMQSAGPVVTAESGTAEAKGNWAIRTEESALGFEITFSGAAVAGAFPDWSADVTFDPDDLESGSISVVVQTASVSVNDATLAGQAAGADGFASADHPTAVFSSESIIATETGYRAEGSLEIRGIASPVALDFTFTEAGGVATVLGTAMLDRMTYGIGAVGAADEGWLKHAVTVEFSLIADRIE